MKPFEKKKIFYHTGPYKKTAFFSNLTPYKTHSKIKYLGFLWWPQKCVIFYTYVLKAILIRYKTIILQVYCLSGGIEILTK